MKMRWLHWCFLLMMVAANHGCTTLTTVSSHNTRLTALAFGYMEVQAIGSNPRGSPTNVRLVFLRNIDTQERFRLEIYAHSKVFFVKLPPGSYQVDRIQFNEGPFMMESSPHVQFHVSAEHISYLGVWKFTVETPRTVRLLYTDIIEGTKKFHKTMSSDLERNPLPIKKVLPLLEKTESRLFSVKPQPRIRYFNR